VTGTRAGTAVDWAGLARSIDGAVVLPESRDYDRVRLPFIARFDDLRPLAVVRCHSPGDIAETIRFGRRHGIHVVPRSGGHSFAGYSSTTGILLDVTELNHVVVADGLAVVGAGARLGAVAAGLGAHGLVIPTGSCPTVGIAGTMLGGGHGILGRMYGLACDHLESALVVLADGTSVECDEGHEPELFWALRGAGGGNFGVVAEFRFRPRPATPMTSFYLTWDYQHAAAVTDAWQRWAPVAGRTVAAALSLEVPDQPDLPPRVELFGAVLAGEGAARAELEGPLGAIGASPATEFVKEMSYADTWRYQAGLLVISGSRLLEVDAEGVLVRQGCRFTKSEFFERPLPADAVDAFVDAVVADRAPGQYRGLELGPWLGAIADLPRHATAFAHRDQRMSIKESVLVAADAAGQARQAAQDWTRHCHASVHPWGSGYVYPNFPDPELADWPRAYHGDNFDRLVAVKRRYDPDNVFHFRQSVPVR
jgi:FAD/FMN-containing dehydrogenase